MEFDLSPLWISLKTATCATAIAFFLGIAAARWMLGNRAKIKSIIEVFFIAPLVLPPTVVGFLLLLLLGRNGAIGYWLMQAGINIIFSWPATVITATVVAFPLTYKTALGAFEQVDANLLSAARTLGASEWRVFWDVLLPLSRSGIIAGTILSFARALGEFGATLMLAGNIPGETQTMPMAVYFAVEAGDMRQASIWVLIILAISMGVLTAVNYWQGKQPKIRNQKSTPISPLPSPPTLTSSSLAVDIYHPLDNFSLNVAFNAEQEAIAILGASGSGKSMTLRSIAGLETPAQGRIVLNGKVLFDSEKGINLPSCDRRIGIVFQNYALFPHLTVAENIAFGLQKVEKKKRHSRVARQITQMHLQGLENRYPHQLSGGQQQRVALARALAIEPEALLLDEPFSALDTYLRHQLEKQLRETLSTYNGVTLFVTHNIEEACRICQNLLVLSQGKIEACGDKHDILEHPPTYTVAQLTGCKNFSRSRAISPHQIEAADWGCILNVIEPIPQPLAYAGFRAYELTFPTDASQENTFPCWLAQAIETPHRMTLYLKLHAPPADASDYHLQAEVFKEKWAILKDRPLPLYVCLEPLRIMLMRE